MLLEVLANIRDVVIIVYGIITTILIFTVLLMAFLIYRKVSGILTSVKNTARNVETFSRNVLRPISHGAQTARPLWKILGWLKGEDGDHRGERVEKVERTTKVTKDTSE